MRTIRSLRRDGSRVSVSSRTTNTGGDAMTNFLISLRKANTDPLKPAGTYDFNDVSSYIEIADGDSDYNLMNTTDPNQWLADIPGTSVLVFVHGFANTSDKVVLRHKLIRDQLPPGFALVSFDWPSGNPGLAEQAYKADKDNATKSAPRLVGFIELLRQKFSDSIHLLAHSMGAYVTETAFQTASVTKVNHVLMAAADVDRQNYLGSSSSLPNFLTNCSDLTAYWSTDDGALKSSQDINKYCPLGLGGFPGTGDPANCFGINCTPYYETYVQGTTIPQGVDNATEYSHVWYMFYPGMPPPPPPPPNDFYADMREVLQGRPELPTRGLMLMLRRISAAAG
jgi:hypothetical protein